MEYNNFEKHISETLRHDEVNLDINVLIQNLHGEKPKRRLPLWIWFSTVLIVAGLVVSFQYIEAEKNGEVIKNHVADTGVGKNQTTLLIEYLNSKSILKDVSITKVKATADPEKGNNVAYIKSSIQQKVYKPNNGVGNTKQNRIYHKVVNAETTSDYGVSANMVDKPVGSENAAEMSTSRRAGEFYISPMSYEMKNIYSGKYGKIKSGDVFCPTFNKRGKFFFELIPEIGYFRPLKKLEQNVNEPDNIFALRKNNETTLEGLNAAMYLRMGKEKLPFFIQVGASVSRMTEKMPLAYSYIRRDTTRGIISVTQSQTGDTITVIFGDIVQETKISGNKTNHHHFTLVDFPVSAGYEKRFGQWAAGVEAGVVLNMSLKAGGQILASDTSFTAIDAPVQAYKNRLGMSYFGGLYLSRDFYESGRFFVSLRGRYIPGSFSTDQNRIRQSYHFLGLNFGYIYSF